MLFRSVARLGCVPILAQPVKTAETTVSSRSAKRLNKSSALRVRNIASWRAKLVVMRSNDRVHGRVRASACNDELEPLRFSNAEVATDFARKMVVDISMPWNCAAFLSDCMVPPRVAGTLA